MVVIIGPDRRGVHGLGHGSIDRSRRDSIDTDAVLGEFRRLLLGEMRQPGFASAIGDAECRGAQTRDRSDVDDGAAALVTHDRRHRLGHQERTGEVDRQDALPILQRHVEQRLEHRDAGIVDQRIDAAELPMGLLHGDLDRSWVGDIGLERQGGIRAVQGIDSGAQRVAQNIQHRNLPAVLQEAGRRREADAARRAGDKGNLFQLRRHVGFFPCCGFVAELSTLHEACHRAPRLESEYCQTKTALHV